jgi:hypothetical protein
MDESPLMLAFAVGGIAPGIVLFGRGLVAYRRDRSISSVATSTLDGLAAGEVRVSGIVEVADQALVSPLQSRPCVWYRARVGSRDDPRGMLAEEERAVHFRLRDAHGAVRVVPDGARWEIEPSFDASTSGLGEEPTGLQRRAGAGTLLAPLDDPDSMSELERQAAIDALLTIRQPEPALDIQARGGAGLLSPAGSGSGRRYQEARLELGDTVTIVGQALPWSDVRARLQAAISGRNIDRAIADDLARARADGLLEGSAEDAWGNAAIPGFGIGRPTRSPELDPEVRPPEVADPSAHQTALERHDIPRDTLVLARGGHGGFAIYKGDAMAATTHHDAAFMLGLVGIGMSTFSALALGIMLSMSA